VCVGKTKRVWTSNYECVCCKHCFASSTDDTVSIIPTPTHTHTHTHVCVQRWIYRDRERDDETCCIILLSRYICMPTSPCLSTSHDIYMPLYICMPTYPSLFTSHIHNSLYISRYLHVSPHVHVSPHLHVSRHVHVSRHLATYTCLSTSVFGCIDTERATTRYPDATTRGRDVQRHVCMQM